MQSTHFDNGKVITVYHNDQVLTFNREDNERVFLQVRELYKVGDYEAISKLVLTAENINLRYADSDLSISKEGVVTINGDVLPASLSKVIVALYKEDAPIDCFINFWNNLNQNPFATTVQRLYDFIERHNITLLPNGDLLMYKVVKRTENPNVFIDIWSETIRQSVGDTIQVPYNKVDNRNEVACSFGLHTSGWDYVPKYGRAMSGIDVCINVSVNPKDICAVPYDDISKIRGRCYTILGVNTQLTEIRQTYYSQQLEDSSYDENEDYDDYWDNVEDDNDEDY